MMAMLHTNVPTDDQAPSETHESLESKTKRCLQELVQAGMTKYGLKKFNTKYLPKIIHDGEKIEAVIYGRYTEGPGLLSWVDRMIVATDRRVISLNHKPGYTDIDEFTYDTINSVEASNAGPFSSVRLNTKVSSANVRFVNRVCAEKFVHYIENRRLEFFQTTYSRA
jgi:hypothetical protein